MTYNEKKSLYESIMKDVAKQVKKLINETDTNTSLYSKLDEEFSMLPPAP